MTKPLNSERKSNLKIAFITWRFPNWHNTFIFYEICELLKLDHKISIFSIEDSEDKIPTNLNCKIHYFSDFIDKKPVNKHITTKFLNSSKKFLLKKPLFKKINLMKNEFLSRFSKKSNFPLTQYSEFGKEVLETFPKIARHLKSFDIIHSCFGNNPATAAMILSKLSHIPYTFETHAYDLFVDFAHSQEKIASTTAIFTISDYNKKFLLEQHNCDKNKIILKRVTYNNISYNGR